MNRRALWSPRGDRHDSSVKDVSFKFPHLVGHRFNYDVQEAFARTRAKLDAN